MRIEELVKMMLDQEALLFGEFTLKSGKKSPFYFNMAKAVKTGEGMARISASLAGFIYANFLEESVPEDRKIQPGEMFLFGPAYKGIPLAAGVAHALFDKFNVCVRWGFNRKEAKLHGDGDDKYLMGELHEGDKVIILDDVLTTGQTKLEARDNIIEASGLRDLQFVGVVALVDRFEGALEMRQEIDAYGVMRIDQLVELCKQKEWITPEHYETFRAYFEEHGLVQN